MSVLYDWYEFIRQADDRGGCDGIDEPKAWRIIARTERRHIMIHLQASTHSDRHAIIEVVKDAIRAGGGDILDFRFFSNISICLNFELPAGRLNSLYENLLALDLQFYESSLKVMQQEVTPPDPARDVIATLQITFIHSEPDLRIPVLPIPG